MGLDRGGGVGVRGRERGRGGKSGWGWEQGKWSGIRIVSGGGGEGLE